MIAADSHAVDDAGAGAGVRVGVGERAEGVRKDGSKTRFAHRHQATTSLFAHAAVREVRHLELRAGRHDPFDESKGG